MQFTKEEIKEINSYGSVSYYMQIIKDLQREPVEFCNVDKRRKCDSYYIQMYNNIVKELNKTKQELEETKQLLKCYQEVLDSTISKVTGKAVK